MRIALAFDLRSDVQDGSDADEEFDSPETVAALEAALARLGHTVDRIGSGPEALRRVLDGRRPDLVFNLAEGRGVSRCREAWLPAALEMHGIACTGSDALTLAATLDKDCAKRLVQSAGVATPAWALVRPEEDPDALARRVLASGPSLPVVVKPAFEGSSKGILPKSFVRSAGELAEAVRTTLEAYRQPVLVEQFVDGEELTVAVTGHTEPSILGILRVVPRDRSRPFLYDLEVKRDWQRQVSYEAPARLSQGAERAVRAAALDAYRVLGCRDLARIDFRLAGDVPWFLEANPLPGLSPDYGDIVILARGLGLSYEDLVQLVLDAACTRLGLVPKPAVAGSGAPR